MSDLWISTSLGAGYLNFLINVLEILSETQLETIWLGVWARLLKFVDRTGTVISLKLFSPGLRHFCMLCTMCRFQPLCGNKLYSQLPVSTWHVTSKVSGLIVLHPWVVLLHACADQFSTELSRGNFCTSGFVQHSFFSSPLSCEL